LECDGALLAILVWETKITNELSHPCDGK